MNYLKFKVITRLLLIFCFSLSNQVNSFENKILLKIDNEIVTSVDLLNEINYLTMVNTNLNNLEKKTIFEISKNSIIREKIKLIELSKYFEELNIENEYYDILLNNFLKKLNLNSKDELKKLVNDLNLPFEIIEKKLKVEFYWNQLILSKFSKDVKINEEEIRNKLAQNSYQKEFLISEILFNLEENEKLSEKFEKIKKEIELNGFGNAALVYSISDTSDNNGELGWIKNNSLSKKIRGEIKKISLGGFSNPIVVPGGFLILMIAEERQTKIETNIDQELKLITNEIANKQLNQFSNIYLNKIKKEIQINEF